MSPAARVPLHLLVVAALAAVLSGCGASAPATGGASTPTTPSATSPSTPPRDVRAVAVTYERTGGIAGQSESAHITLANSPEGYSKARVRTVLDAASRPALRNLNLPPVPRNLCCDRYFFTVRVAWSDGSSRTYRTADGLHRPPALRRLLAALG
jgi:hypothetical protein